jgi:hypothetical protein
MLTVLHRLGKTWQLGHLERIADRLTDKGQLCHLMCSSCTAWASQSAKC